jgi:hypothetical protein
MVIIFAVALVAWFVLYYLGQKEGVTDNQKKVYRLIGYGVLAFVVIDFVSSYLMVE